MYINRKKRTADPNRHNQIDLATQAKTVPPLVHIKGLFRLPERKYSKQAVQLSEIDSSQTEELFLQEF